MRTARTGSCDCPDCLYEADHPDAQYHWELRLVLATLSAEQRRLLAAVESRHLGRGGVASVAQITGLDRSVIARGRRELAALLAGTPIKKERKPVRGRPRIEEKYPAITATLEAMVSDEVAGDPMGEQRWVRSSVAKLTRRLREKGFPVGHSTVWALLTRMGFSLRTAIRRRRGITRDPAARDEQFRYIAAQRKAFSEVGLPVISVDTKKKELIGNFRNPGRIWCKEAIEVNEKDFVSEAECLAVPFGIYDVARNTGYVVVGTSHNTPEFAVTSIARWWREEGCLVYPGKAHVLILADGGGGNGSRSKAWKFNLQQMLCDRFGLTVTVCHYPPGCSKWNPVEHRLFSQISSNWAGKPLRSLRVMLNYIRGTTTTTGLRVKAQLDEGIYKKAQKVTREEMEKLRLMSVDEQVR
jgi:hypothetical protein